MHGATSESVARYISEGQFGLWRETGKLNELAAIAHRQDIGFGEGCGAIHRTREATPCRY